MVRNGTHSLPSPPHSRRFGIAALIFTALALSACAPRLAALGVENRTPAIEHVNGEERYVTRDGLALGLQHWNAANPKAVVVALHGMNDYSRFLSLPAPYLAEQGYTIYAYDQRGFGRSPNRGLWAGNDVLRRDLGDFVDVVRARHPGLPVFVLGESMGGAVVLTAMASANPPNADGTILVAPAVWGQRSLPPLYRASLWVSAHLVPFWELTGSNLHVVPTDNIEVLREMSRDPYVIKETRADAVYGLVSLMDEAYAAPERLKGKPVLLLYGDKDQVVPHEPTKEVAAKLGPSGEVREFPNGYHMLLRDKEGPTIWSEIAGWLARRLPSASKRGVVGSLSN